MANMSNPWSLTYSDAPMLLIRWSGGLLLPGRSTMLAHCNPKCQGIQSRRSKGQQARGPVLLTCLLYCSEHQTFS